MKKTLFTSVLFGFALAAQPQADNSKANKRADQSATAEDQSNSKDDLKLAKEIRREITKDSTLSTYAHNAKVIVKNGSVTLKGPVRSEEEKNSVEVIAKRVAGSGSVVNELEVAKSDK